MKKNICVWCGSSEPQGPYKPDIMQSAHDVGDRIGQYENRLIYGGGNIGLMGIVAQAVLKHDAYVTAISLQPLEDFAKTPKPTNVHIVDDMGERKQQMMQLSDVFIVLPGGPGTVDELYEGMTHKQFGTFGMADKVPSVFEKKPIYGLNISGFYDEIIAHQQKQVAWGFMKPEHAELITWVESAEQIPFHNF